VNYNQNYFIYLCPFGNSPTGQTRRRIFAHDGSNDADSRKDVHFLGFVVTAPHLGGKIPKSLQFWWREYAFSSQTREIEKHAYYQIYCIDSNQILHSDKDYQMPFVGGPNTHITGLARRRSSALLSRPTVKNFKFQKSMITASVILKSRNVAISRR